MVIITIYTDVYSASAKSSNISGPISVFDTMGGYTSVFGLTYKHSGGLITSDLPKMHSGGKVLEKPTLRDDEVNRTLQVGERVLSKEDNKRYEAVMPDLVRYVATVPKGIEIEPAFKKPELFQNNENLMSAEAKINQAMTMQLERQNTLMEQQNSMISNMGDSKGNVIVMPVAPDAASVLKVLQDNPRAVQAILGQNRKMGFR